MTKQAKQTHAPQPFRVFVYGTLKPGQANHYLIERHPSVLSIDKATIAGRIYGCYVPMLLLGDDIEDRVTGYVVTIADPALLQQLDIFEGILNEKTSTMGYRRLTVQAQAENGDDIGPVFVYATRSPTVAERFGPRSESGTYGRAGW